MFKQKWRLERRVQRVSHVCHLSPALSQVEPLPTAYVMAWTLNQWSLQHTAAFRNSTTLKPITLKMADNDIATRAPESDAQEDVLKPAEDSVFPGDTRAQEGPSMGVSIRLKTRSMV